MVLMGIITQKTHHVRFILAVTELWQPYMDYNEKILGFGTEPETAILAVLLYMYISYKKTYNLPVRSIMTSFSVKITHGYE